MFTLKINTRNGAFNSGGDDGMQSDPALEVHRLLTLAAGQVLSGSTSGVLRDYNGHTVGEWKLTRR